MPTPQTTRKKGDLMVSLLANVDGVNNFERMASGKWTCIKQIDFATTRGRVQSQPERPLPLGQTYSHRHGILARKGIRKAQNGQSGMVKLSEACPISREA